ncbi:MAG TPA: lysophospholipid acyltransferase family protein [Dehalococcoidia bacterium]|nr:lysophospholipid acyltransferase family protein [Dehalococcoidia bacterium]
MAWFYWLVTYFVRWFLMPLYATIEVRGVENVPRTGPLLIASNHLNDADPGVLATRIPRRLVFMAKAELFRIPVLAQALRLYGAFPVRRREADLSALRRSHETLRRGLALVLFPEGTRAGEAARLGPAWPGAGLIALRNNALILPCAITGSQDMGMPGMFLRVLRRRRVTLTIGEPFRLDPVPRINTEASAAGADLIMRRIAALLPPEYRGYYGEEAGAGEHAARGQT